MAMGLPSASKRAPKKFAGELRSTDVRSYGTLDQLLSPGFQIQEPPCPSEGAATGLDPQGFSALASGDWPVSEFKLTRPAIEASKPPGLHDWSGSTAQSSHLLRSSCCSQSASSTSSFGSDSGSDYARESKVSGQKTVRLRTKADNMRGSARPMSQQRELGIARPQSPLRPGVFHSCDAHYHVKMTPKCLPEPAQCTISGLFPGISRPPRPATSDAVSLANAAIPGIRRLSWSQDRVRGVGQEACGLSQWETIVQKIEDEGRTDDSRHYEAWRRRVVECSRTMQEEVARFKFEE